MQKRISLAALLIALTTAAPVWAGDAASSPSAQSPATGSEPSAQTNKDLGAAYMAENAKKDGWKTTASGLQYRIITPGIGDHPRPTDVITAVYEGTLIDGTVFDSSAKRNNEPLVIPLNRLIPAWREALAMIGPGGKMEIVAPSNLAYGDQGAPPLIPPGATLRFTLELQDFDVGRGNEAGGDALVDPTAEEEMTDEQLQQTIEDVVDDMTVAATRLQAEVDPGALTQDHQKAALKSMDTAIAAIKKKSGC